MNSFFAILVVILFLLLIGLAMASKVLGGWRSVSAAKLPYRKRDYLLTKAERSFYEVLRNVVGDELTLFAKVRLLDLVYLAKGTENWQHHRNLVSSKHVDFLLCDRQRVSPLLVIELDDSSHEREDRMERDAFIDEALAAAGLPILHVAVKHAYSPNELAELIQQKITNQAA